MLTQDLSKDVPGKTMILETQQCDGITMALCREAGVVNFNKDPIKARQNVLEAIIANSKAVLRKLERNEPLQLEEEKRLELHAKKITKLFQDEGDVSPLFQFKEL